MSYLLSIFLILGGAFTFFATLGVYRFPDLYSRLHAASKAASFGVGWLILASVLYFGEFYLWVKGLLIIGFIYLTIPIASHLIARAAYFLKVPRFAGTTIDELDTYLNKNQSK